MRNISFSPEAFEEYNNWAITDEKIFSKLRELIKEISRDPFKGKGKPEPLKGIHKGYWSRRINEEHRIIYKVDDSNRIYCQMQGALSMRQLVIAQ